MTISEKILLILSNEYGSYDYEVEKNVVNLDQKMLDLCHVVSGFKILISGKTVLDFDCGTGI